MERAEADYQIVEARAERLENLEELLKEENTRGREILIRQLAEADSPVHGAPQPEEDEEEDRGNRHANLEDFKQLDSGRVKVSNVQIRILRGNTLRISLDLRNLEANALLSGEVKAALMLRNGEEQELVFNPRESGSFKIAKFKRTVLTTQAPKGEILADADLILEVRENRDKLIFRNIYPIGQ